MLLFFLIVPHRRRFEWVGTLPGTTAIATARGFRGDQVMSLSANHRATSEPTPGYSRCTNHVAVLIRKLETAAEHFSAVLAWKLEQQREHFESKLARLRSLNESHSHKSHDSSCHSSSSSSSTDGEDKSASRAKHIILNLKNEKQKLLRQTELAHERIR